VQFSNTKGSRGEDWICPDAKHRGKVSAKQIGAMRRSVSHSESSDDTSIRNLAQM